MSNPLDRLYLETVPARITKADPAYLGPTHQWALHLESLEFDWPLIPVKDVA
jgi:hypothetical protein